MKGKSSLFSYSHEKIAQGNISFMPKEGERSLFAKFIRLMVHLVDGFE